MGTGGKRGVGHIKAEAGRCLFTLPLGVTVLVCSHIHAVYSKRVINKSYKVLFGECFFTVSFVLNSIMSE